MFHCVVYAMTKFVYCMMCEHGFRLKPEEITTCKKTCRNVGGRYINPEGGVYIKAEICAKNPDAARFVGIHKFKPEFDSLKKTFLEIDDNETWKAWEKGHLARDQKEWDNFLERKGYAVGTGASLKKTQWHKNWQYNESLCKELTQ